MAYLEKFNRDDIHLRSVIIGLINLLNQEVFFENVWSNDEQEIVEVPFYYSTTGDERYLQDAFLDWRSCAHPKFMDGNFDPMPRGVVKLNDSTINKGNMTQRWIRGNYTRIVDGQMEVYNAYINSLPLDLNFDVEIHTDTMTNMFKLYQSILEVFYKVQIFNVAYKGLMIPCQVGFPETYPIEKSFEFSYPSETKIAMTFTLSLETYFPIFDEPNLGSKKAIKDSNLGTPMNNNDISYYVGESRRNKINVKKGQVVHSITDNGSANGKTARLASNKMDAILIGDFKQINDSSGNTINIINPIANESRVATSDVTIKWTFANFIHKVNLYYALYPGTEWVQIATLIDASIGEYTWTIPNMIGLIDVLVITPNAKGSGAVVKAVVDIDGSISDIIIVEPGNNYDQTTMLEIESSTGSGASIIPSVIDGKIVGYDSERLVGGSGYVATINTKITFKVSDATGRGNGILLDENGDIGFITIV
ncbi:MAG: hypothetical protein WC979_01195 [Candidatus Pacearchaeota archaeon]|jgi:hypothetical protein|nr:hypothetical protein [Clostridia bacterium]